ncbi:uncharacterized protein MELLADRAFT_91246 [Melampsora larici-populina 98AG31]|uniref:Uncharacterized protein n=1 Tax=Melampsora larici-populina (strain 98AG31 / pathotype 3-4-7) TaxID=747676 RepID=F4RYC9_MELLP|nr:uncharacterized protein MELLADRAFT_91246 [Melampsora larici-populina 98AG31]EGG02654.1 hypothetical protein MELLADRAFT_91246 [Melampsora larici-populina 98AG31]
MNMLLFWSKYFIIKKTKWNLQHWKLNEFKHHNDKEEEEILGRMTKIEQLPQLELITSIDSQFQFQIKVHPQVESSSRHRRTLTHLDSSNIVSLEDINSHSWFGNIQADYGCGKLEIYELPMTNLISFVCREEMERSAIGNGFIPQAIRWDC